MLSRTSAARAVAGISLAALLTGCAQSAAPVGTTGTEAPTAPAATISATAPTPAAATATTEPSTTTTPPEPSTVTTEPSTAPESAAPAPQTGYASVDGLEMYYEIHGTGQPLVLLHGAYTTIDLSFGALLPTLAEDRQVIAVELQGHGHTAYRDAPLSYEQLADDTAALLKELNIEQADFFGYSLGANVALQAAIRHPDLVRKLVVVSAYFDPSGLYPGVLEGIAQTKPEDFTGSGLPEAYASVAPDPDGWPSLVEKVKELDLGFSGWPPESIESIRVPTLIVVGDSDIVSVEHAARMFGLLGGGVPGDFAGLPSSQLAVLPGTTHIGVLAERTDSLHSTITPFLDAPDAAAN